MTQPRGVLRAQPPTGRARPDPGALRVLGRLRLDQPRRRRAALARSASSRSQRCSTPGRWSRCGPSGGTPAVCRSTGSWARRRSSSSTTCSRRTRSSGSPSVSPRVTRPTSTRVRSSTAELQYLRTMSEGMAGHGARPRTCRSQRKSAGSGAPGRLRAAHARPGSARLNDAVSRRAPRPWLRHARPQRARGHRASTSPCATASRTTSCCRCTAALPPTGSARWARRRPSWRSGR